MDRKEVTKRISQYLDECISKNNISRYVVKKTKLPRKLKKKYKKQRKMSLDVVITLPLPYITMEFTL